MMHTTALTPDGASEAPTTASRRVVTIGRCGATITCAMVSMRVW
jgi:hypothetical protein